MTRATFKRYACLVMHGKLLLKTAASATCQVATCLRRAEKRGYCGMHYQRLWKHGDPIFERPTFDICRVRDCKREPRSSRSGLCEMHYCRIRRTGSTDRAPRSSYRRDGRGYVQLYLPRHPLADSHGFVYEHRVALFGKIGRAKNACVWCSREVRWSANGAAMLVADHRNGETSDNRPSNLVASCPACNMTRDQDRRGRGSRACEVCGEANDRRVCSRRCAGVLGGRAQDPERLRRMAIEHHATRRSNAKATRETATKRSSSSSSSSTAGR